MLRKCFLQNTKLNYRYFYKEVVIVSNKSVTPHEITVLKEVVMVSNKFVTPYEIAESEEIDIQKIENYNTSKETNRKPQWGDETIDME